MINRQRLKWRQSKQLPHYIIFDRTLGHCVTQLVRAASLHEALTKLAVSDREAELQSDGSLVTPDGLIYSHPLAFVESHYKSDDKYDELQWSEKENKLLNGSSWQIRGLPARALEAEIAEVFCSAEPWSIGEYISLCRSEFRKKHPRSRARAFVWYLNNGPLVTFHHRRNKAHDRPITVVGRYLIPWQHQHWPRPYTLTQEMVQEWYGSYDDILEQLRVDYPF